MIYADVLKIIAHDAIAVNRAEIKGIGYDSTLPEHSVKYLLAYSLLPLAIYSDGHISGNRKNLPSGVALEEKLTCLQAYNHYGASELLRRLINNKPPPL